MDKRTNAVPGPKAGIESERLAWRETRYRLEQKIAHLRKEIQRLNERLAAGRRTDPFRGKTRPFPPRRRSA
jgi:hypothetical protein